MWASVLAGMLQHFDTLIGVQFAIHELFFISAIALYALDGDCHVPMSILPKFNIISFSITIIKVIKAIVKSGVDGPSR